MKTNQSMKVTKMSAIKFQKLKQKYDESKQEVFSLKAELSAEKGRIRKLNKRVDELVVSRAKWKEKSKKRRLKNKSLNARLSGREAKAPRHHYPMEVVELCQKLRIQAGCSYRSIPKILEILNACLSLGMTRRPCANTIENWVSKMGLYQLQRRRDDIEEVCLVVDECAGVGKEKLLVVLGCEAHKQGKEALSMTDMEVCYIEGRSSWNGEEIKEVLEEVKQTNQLKVDYVLSDQASVLTSATRKFGFPHLPDIGHAIGTCLRKTFKKEDCYKKFSRQISDYQAKSVNQDLTYLRPPKQRVKARFMNLKPVVKWAQTMLESLGELSKKEYDFFKEIQQHHLIINDLTKCMNVAEQISLIFKKKGLSKQTLEIAQKQVDKYNKEDGAVKSFLGYVEEYLAKYKGFIGDSVDSFQVSSDVIESMFGKYKFIKGNNPLVGVSQLCLELATYSVKDKDFLSTAKNALEDIFTDNIHDWVEQHSTNSQAVQRQMFFKKRA